MIMIEGKIHTLTVLVILIVGALPATGQDEGSVAVQDTTTSPAAADSNWTVLETMVVTASRKEQAIEEVPASVTVRDQRDIDLSPADNYFADGLRTVPGTNVAQTSAADVSISTRTATNVIPQGQLAMVDYRTVYQDFNGFVLWGTIPVEMEDVDRIEIIRGPGSAVWGANAMHGIVHIITKAPRDMIGTRVKVTAGELSTYAANFSHAGAGRKVAYRVSGGYNFQGPFTKPTGTVPGSEGPLNPGGTPYPEYVNPDTRRYRVNARVDFDMNEESILSVDGGYAGLEGMFMGPGGPSTMENGTLQAFGKLDFTRKNMRVTAFMNHDAYDGMFVIGALPVTSNEQTYNIDFTDTRYAGDRHALTYGGNYRYNVYDISITPKGKNRTSYGAFLQDDIFLNEKLRFVIGARWDYVDNMGDVISPRASLLIAPIKDQRFRLSYNRAFQAPSMLQNYLELPNFLPITFPDYNNPGSGEFETVPIFAMSYGNTELEPKKLDAFEVGWTGTFADRLTLEVTGYWNEFKNAFQLVVLDTYTGSNPPPDWPFDPALLDDELAGVVPSAFQVENLGGSTEKGVEIGSSFLIDRAWSVFVNYSWQDEPELADFTPMPMPDGTERLPVNTPPEHRFNVGFGYDTPQFFGNASAAYQDKAFWTDVMDSRMWGPTDAFTMVNAKVGVRFPRQGLVISVSALNLLDATVQQHVWGDFIDRRIIGEVSYRF